MSRSRVPTRRPLAHLPGHFYFADLRTTGFELAEDFYGPLFGWNFLDVSGNIEGQDYRIARIAERDTAGIGLVDHEDEHARPHWRCYLTVADISATLARAVLLGARVVEPLVRIPGDGALATLQDPSGATLTLWQYAPGNSSVTVKDDIGAPLWNELHTADPHAAERFYTDLVGWTYEDATCGREAHRLAVPARRDDQQALAGAIVPLSDHSQHTGFGSHWRVYFNVHDTEATADQVVQLGGRVVAPPEDWAGYGRAAVLEDPAGAKFVALRPDINKA